jgi:hypothetical protein
MIHTIEDFHEVTKKNKGTKKPKKFFFEFSRISCFRGILLNEMRTQ